ncbi:MAG: hypothetical protein Fur0043_22140 [Anaerolineales bacterium]
MSRYKIFAVVIVFQEQFYMRPFPKNKPSIAPMPSPAREHRPLEDNSSFLLLFQNHPIPMWIYDLETLAFLEVNDAAVEKYGFSRQEFLSRTLLDIRPAEDVPRLLQDVRQKRPAWQQSGEWRHRLRNGKVIDVEITSHTLEYQGRSAVLVLAQDITKRKQALQALRRNRDLLLSLGRAVQVVQNARSPQQAYRALGREIKALGYGLIIFMGSENKQYLQMVHTTFSPRLLHMAETLTQLQPYEYRLPLQPGNTFERILNGERAVFLERTSQAAVELLPPAVQPMAERLVKILNSERGIAAPLRVEKATLGLLAITGASLTEEDLPAVEVFAAQIVSSLQNTRLAQQAQAELAERRQAEVELQQRNHDLALINAINQAANQGKSLAAILDLVMAQTHQMFNCNGLTLHLFDESRNVLVLQNQSIAPAILAQIEKLIRRPIPPIAHRLDSPHPFRQVLETKKSRLLTKKADIQAMLAAYLEATPWDATTRRRIEKLLPMLIEILGYRSVMIIPLIFQEKLLGTLSMGSRRQLTSADLQRFETIAGQLTAIIQRKRAEEEIHTLNAELEARVEERTRQLKDAQEQLLRQERLAALGQVAGSIGHELRNPLAVIANAVYFLKMVLADAKTTVRDYLDIIDNETRAADKIVTDLLDFTRIKSLDLQPAAVTDLVARTLERHPAPPSVQVTLDLPPHLPPVYADPRHVEQILGNLVTNACQAMPSGGQLSVISRQSSVTDESLMTDNCLLITVKDSGPGIPPENLEKIFEPLFTTKPRGIGLGLAVSRKLAEANGGRLEVHSEAGKGAAFTLYLPVYQDPKGLPAL